MDLIILTGKHTKDNSWMHWDIYANLAQNCKLIPGVNKHDKRKWVYKLNVSVSLSLFLKFTNANQFQ